MTRLNIVLIATVMVLGAAGAALAQGRTQNVILVTLDGTRTQEMFGGFDREIFEASRKSAKAPEQQALYQQAYDRFWAASAGERRQKLMPFLWTELVKQGSIAGNAAKGSRMMVTNRHRVSYPGYSEILTGHARDTEIVDNTAKQNPHPTVLEFMRSTLQLDASRVAAFTSWDTFQQIAQHVPDSIMVNAGQDLLEDSDAQVAALNALQTDVVPPWPGVRHDGLTFRLAKRYLELKKPRLLFISFDETDEWSHEGRYDLLLPAIHNIDGWLKELWTTVQSMDEYRDKTTIIVTTDHGRGTTTTGWRDHGEKIEGAQNIWAAFISPDSALRGEWQNASTIYQNQIAATIARLLGADYSKQDPEAGRPIDQLFAPGAR